MIPQGTKTTIIMKISIVKQEKTFKPIVLNITIESEEELCELWHRMNAPGSILVESSEYSETNFLVHKPGSFDTTPLWEELNYIVKDINLRA